MTNPYDVPHIPLGLAFDDVLLIPQYSEITSRSQVSTRSLLAGDIYLNIPIISSNMDTVTMADMAIAMAKLGGIGFIHRFLSIEDEVREISKVKRYRSHIIFEPYEVCAEATIAEAVEIMDRHGVGGLMVAEDDHQLVGILTRRDVDGAPSTDLVQEMMTPRERMVVGKEDIDIAEAKKLMHSARVEKLPLVDEADRVTGLIVMKDIHKLADHPNSTIDREGRLMVASSVGVVNEYIDRAEATLEAGADLLVVDVAHGHASHVGKALQELKKRFGHVPIIAGDVATGEGVEYLAQHGADAVRVGIGPGCFVAGTRVLMANGTYKNIEEVQAGDRVLNKNGEPVSVVGAKCMGEREVMAYRHTAYCHETWATPDHRHWAGDLSSVSEATVSSSGYVNVLERPMLKDGNKVSKIGWMELGDMDRSAFLAPRHLNLELPESFTISLDDFAKRPGNLKRYNIEIEPSYQLGYMLGTFLGDGCSKVTSNRNSEAGSVAWYFNKHEVDISSKLVAAVEFVTGVRPTVKEKDSIQLVNFYSLQWARLLQEFGKKTEKHLPEKYLCGDRDYINGLLDGLLDSDGHRDKGGRRVFDNTSPRLMELYSVLCHITEGSFPSFEIKTPDPEKRAGGLSCEAANMSEAYRARLAKSHAKRQMDDYIVIKKLDFDHMPRKTVLVYDIEVDCPTHSFIANNVIVHNSACTTRLVAGAGYPQFSALLECSRAGQKVGIPVIADGGIRGGTASSPAGADLSKAIGAGASTAMLGSALAGTRESPGLIEERDGHLVKTYRGMASMDAFLSKQVGEGKADEAAVDYVPEGVTAVIPYRDEPAAKVIHKLVGGLRSGMAYSNATTIEEFHQKVRFVQQTSAGLGESKPHVLDRSHR